MELDKLYQSILNSLKEGKRRHIQYTRPEMEAIVERSRESLRQKNYGEIKKLLCLIGHSQKSTPLFIPFLQAALQLDEDELVIYALGASSRHIIDYFGLEGMKLPEEFITSLKRPLEHKNPEVVEWSLRTIEQMGRQSRRLEKQVCALSIKFWQTLPPPIGNPHLKNSYAIIKLLKARWEKQNELFSI